MSTGEATCHQPLHAGAAQHVQQFTGSGATVERHRDTSGPPDAPLQGGIVLACGYQKGNALLPKIARVTKHSARQRR